MRYEAEIFLSTSSSRFISRLHAGDDAEALQQGVDIVRGLFGAQGLVMVCVVRVEPGSDLTVIGRLSVKVPQPTIVCEFNDGRQAVFM